MARTIAERHDALPALGEVFREHGYEGASLALITESTGLGKGSLYHFFPGGKEEMANAVLDDIHAWFEREVFMPLQTAEPDVGIATMFAACSQYFLSGQRICLVGGLAIGKVRDRFSQQISAYFSRWETVLTKALRKKGYPAKEAHSLAEDVLIGIQGSIVLTRALHDDQIFVRNLKKLKARCSHS